MGNAGDIEERLASRLRALRLERGWSLDELAQRSEVSRASLSRLENGEVSPTAAVLGRLCAAFGLTLSRLMQEVEGTAPAVVRRVEQTLWEDPETRLRRLEVSPPGTGLAGEVIEVALPAGAEIAYAKPPRNRLEHHLVVLEGALQVTVGDTTHALATGDALRYRLDGASAFATASGARYLLFLVW